MRSTRFLLVTSVGLLTAAMIHAQNDPNRPQDPTRREPGSQTGSTSSQGDRVLAAWLLADNQKEVALAEIARERATNEEVKQFATRMIEDHKMVVNKLKQHAPPGSTESDQGTQGTRPGETTPSTPRGQEGERSSTQQGSRPGETRSPGGRASPTEGAGSLDIVSLKRELTQQCIQSARRELESKSGAEFDKCFMFLQIAAHMEAVDTLKVFKNRAGRELAQVITEALPKVEAHLEQARSIAKKVEGAESRPRLGN
jgi:predicted outer membrane protein